MIDEKFVVEKKNVLNEFKTKDMDLQELRLFSIYLAKINARNENTRLVRFSLNDFKEIMNLENIKPSVMQKVTDSLLHKIFYVPNTETGGYNSFVLFQQCKVDKDDNDEWYIELDVSNQALPLMFNYKNNYFKYELWNIINLNSVFLIRMYEILKQHEYQHEFEISVEDLKSLLGMENGYPNRFDRFKERVLDKSKKILSEKTDISFTYSKGKSGFGGKWLTIKFLIEKNPIHSKLGIEKYLTASEIEEIESLSENKDILSMDYVRDKYLKYFTKKEFNSLKEICCSTLLLSDIDDEENKICATVLLKTINDFEVKNEKGDIHNKLSYIKKILDNNADNEIESYKKRKRNAISKETSYDIDEFEDLAITFSKNTKKVKPED